MCLFSTWHCIVLYCIIIRILTENYFLLVYIYKFSCAFGYNSNTFRIFFGIRISRILIARLLVRSLCESKVLLPSTSDNFSWLSSSTMNIKIFPSPLVVAVCYWSEHNLLNSPKRISFLYILPKCFSKFCTSILAIKSNSVVLKSSQCFLPI